MTATERSTQIGRRFGQAADQYEEHADVQRETAARLADRIARLSLPQRPRILEIGCGTGLLSRELAARLGEADWTLTDIAPRMLDTARSTLNLPGTVCYLSMDGEHPSAACGTGFDLICASLSTQWFTNLNKGLAALCALLAPGGYLCIATLAAGTFEEWQRAHVASGLMAATPTYPAAADIGPEFDSVDVVASRAADSGQTHATLPNAGSTRLGLDHIDSDRLGSGRLGSDCLNGIVEIEQIFRRYASGLQFLRGLRSIGATTPATAHRSLSAPALRRVLQNFDSQGSTITYQIAFGTWRKSPPIRMGAFVTGTDTGVGKTLVSAILAQAWTADYWKPLQTGLADEPGDTETVTRLAELAPSRVHAPFCELQASLSPWAAATIENRPIDIRYLSLPPSDHPIIVEGAGGLYVPIDDTFMMIDLALRFGLPIVLVARSGLGTINHTLLSLEALRRRGVYVLGVVMSGVPNPANKAAIERFGNVKVILEIPPLEHIDCHVVSRLARQVQGLELIPSE
jgi:dethiobiotin synthase